VRPFAEVHLDEPYQTVITSSAGYPLDKTYYQTVKGMVGAMEILEPGGDIFIVSEISEGFGSPEYLEAQKRRFDGTLAMDGFLARYRAQDRPLPLTSGRLRSRSSPCAGARVRLFTQQP
jgi:hypothetical protein